MKNKTKKQQRRFNIGSSWLILIIVLVSVLTTTIMANHNHPSLNYNTDGLSVDNGDQKINWDRYKAIDIELEETYKITKSGIYHFTGTLDDGAIIVDVTDEGEAKLILDNVTINNSNGPAIACYSADDLVISLIGDNKLSDGETYSGEYNDDVKGAIYSKADLTFEGDGKLSVEANNEDGIVSKDDLKFNDGTYIISAVDDGIRGKDSVYIVKGSFDINAGADAIKATNEENTQKGFIIVEEGTINIVSGAKGLKAIKSILLYSGNFAIKSKDDAIHSNNYIGIIDGNYTIESGDDAIHADQEIIIDGGNIDINKSYEGIEAEKITVNNGVIEIVSIDDGINAGGGNEEETINRQPGNTMEDVDENCEININGGTISVNASGDGIDSNGKVVFNGGKTIVDGPTNNGNGALDAGTEILINGGEVIAVGASGMAGSFSQSSSVNNLNIYLSEVYAAGTKIEIIDLENQTIIKHTTKKTFSHIAVGTTELKQGENYELYINDKLVDTFTISGIKTNIGNNNINNKDFRR